MPQQTRVRWHGARVLAAVREHAERGVRMAAEHLLTESRRLVPLEEGTLERSGAVVDAGDLACAVVYDTPYAVRQHEDLTYRHAPGRQPKFLEQPANAERGTMQQIIAAQIRRAMRQ